MTYKEGAPETAIFLSFATLHNISPIFAVHTELLKNVKIKSADT
jgi:hypothetical protein